MIDFIEILVARKADKRGAWTDWQGLICSGRGDFKGHNKVFVCGGACKLIMFAITSTISIQRVTCELAKDSGFHGCSAWENVTRGIVLDKILGKKDSYRLFSLKLNC